MSGLADVAEFARRALDASLLVWWEWMLPMSAQVAIVALIVAAIDLLFVRRPWPRLEALLWGLVLVKLLLPPWLGSPVSVMRLIAEQPAGWRAPAEIDLVWVRTLGAIWLAGALGCASLTVLAYRRTAKAIQIYSAPATPSVEAALAIAARRVGLRRVPQARMVTRADEAAVFGLVRPVVLVPSELAGDALRLEHVLLHECVHLRRGDPWWSILSLVLGWFYWFHPALWLTRARLAALRELACDAHVARLLGEASEGYRQTLLSIARTMLARERPAPIGQLAFLLPTPRMRAGDIGWWLAGWAGGWWGGSLLVARLGHLRTCVGPDARPRLVPALVACALAAVVAVSCLPLANPPKPLFDQWAAAQGCLQKRFIILRALTPE